MHEPVAVAAIIARASALLEGELDHHHHTTLSCDLTQGVPEVQVDALEIEQVFVILLSNSLEATRDSRSRRG